MIEESLYSHLANDTAINALIAGRVYGVTRPQNSPQPSIIYKRVDTKRTQGLCGTDSTVRGDFLIESSDKTLKGAKTLAKAVRESLVDYTGAMVGTHICSISILSEKDSSEAEPGLICVEQVFLIWFREE